jgi:hypothetical protein
MSKAKLVVAIGFLGLSVLPLSAGEVLTNPGFETGSLAPWVVGRTFGTITENWNVTSAVSHSGTDSATDVGNEELKQTFAGVLVSSITQVSFWAEHPSSTVNAVAYDFFYSDSTDVENIVNTTGTGFNFFDVTSQLSAGKTLVGFSVFGNSGGRTYVDDLNITTTPEPNSLLLIAGSAVWLFTRRRLAQ